MRCSQSGDIMAVHTLLRAVLSAKILRAVVQAAHKLGAWRTSQQWVSRADMLLQRTSARLSDSFNEPGAGLAGFAKVVRARVAFQSGSVTWVLTLNKLPRGDRVSPSRSRRTSAW